MIDIQIPRLGVPNPRRMALAMAVLCIGLTLQEIRAAHAGGFDTKGLGSRALGMGGAAIGLADDWSAVFWNPAGLAFLTGSAFSFEFQTITSQQRSSMSVRNIPGPPPDYLAGDFVKFEATREVEPDRYSNKTLGAFIPTPDLGWYGNFGDYTLATGLYATSGGGVSWTDRLDGFNPAALGDAIDGNISLGFFTLNVPFAVAMKFGERVALGVNVAGVIGYNTREVTKTYDYADPNQADLKFENSSTSFGLGVAVDVGLKVKLTETLSLGGVFRAPYSVEGTGESYFEIPQRAACGAPDCDYEQYVEEGESDVITEQPMRWGVGLGYVPTDRLKMDVDFYWVAHSDFITKSTYDVPEGTYDYLADSNPEWGFEDKFMIRSGVEYLVGASAFRAGFIYDPSPFKPERASLTSPRFTDAYIGTAGYGQAFGPWRMDLAYQFVYSPERQGTVTTPSPDGVATPEVVAMTGQAHVATVTVGYGY